MKILKILFVIALSINFSLAFADKLTMQPRVYDGTDSTPEKYPDYVYIFDDKVSCGGVLISKQWVLTKANCVTDSNGKARQPNTFSVAILPSKINYDALTRKKVIEYKNLETITKIVVPSQYRPFKVATDLSNNYDIALLKLSKTQNITPVILNNDSSRLPSQSTLVGLGRTLHYGADDSFSSITLQAATLPTQKKQLCIDAYATGNITLPQNILCAGKWGRQNETSAGACDGDAGSPLYIRKGGKKILAGIALFSSGQCGMAAPTVFLDVSKYKSFLTQSGAVFYQAQPPLLKDSFEK